MYPELTRDDVFMIATPRLWLRWPRLADAADVARFGGHPDVATMTASWPVHCDADYARTRIATMRAQNAAGTGLSLVIAPREAWSQTIGLVGIGSTGDDEATGRPVGNLGYHLDPAHWGRGYASEALAGLIANTRLLTRTGRLVASVMPHNRASMRVLEKNGFARIGRGQHTSPLRGLFDVERYERSLRTTTGHRAPQVFKLCA